jgi:hypothetical protein
MFCSLDECIRACSDSYWNSFILVLCGDMLFLKTNQTQIWFVYGDILLSDILIIN